MAQMPASDPPTSVEPEEPLAVLVAIPDPDVAKAISAQLGRRGAKSAAVFDGVDAMLEIQRQEPKVVVLAADLPKMFGFQVCEVVKRNESLKKIHVVLAGAVHHPDRYRRSPSELYGADDYVEMPDLPDAMLPILARIGVLDSRRADDLGEDRTPASSRSDASGHDDDLGFGLDDAPSSAPSADPRTAPAEAPAFQTTPTFEPGLGAAQSQGVTSTPAPSPDLATESPASVAPGSGDDFGRNVDGGFDGSFVTGAETGTPSPGASADLDPGDLQAPEPTPASAPTLAPAPPMDFALEFDDTPPEEPPVAVPDPAQAPAAATDPIGGSDPFAPAGADMGADAAAAPSPAPAAGPRASEGRAQAERLARIIVSDIVLYNEEKFTAAVQAGTVAQSMAGELDEGRALFSQRIDQEVRGEADFLTEELLRVARARGMK